MGRAGQRPLVVTRDTAQQGINGRQARVQNVHLKQNFSESFLKCDDIFILLKILRWGRQGGGYLLENLIWEGKFSWSQKQNVSKGHSAVSAEKSLSTFSFDSCAPLPCSFLSNEFPPLRIVDRDPAPGKLTRRTAGVRCSCPRAHPACPRAMQRASREDPGERGVPMLFSRAHCSHLHASLTDLLMPRASPLARSSLACGQVPGDCLSNFTVGRSSPLLFIRTSSASGRNVQVIEHL